MKYNLVVCGGTFDHFHKGHEEFLRFSLSHGNNLIIGLTSDEYVRKSKVKDQKSKLIELYEERKISLLNFLKQERILDRVKIVKIEDVFGPTLDKSLQIDAIVVSKNTVPGAELINSKRKELGLKEIEVLIAPSVRGEDGKLISSRQIRDGEIDTDGKTFINPAFLRKPLFLPKDLRYALKKPFGNLIYDLSKYQSQFKLDLVATVGDVTTKKFNDLKIIHKISVIDFNVGRKKIFSKLDELDFPDLTSKSIIFKIKNPPSNITPLLFKACQKAWGKNNELIILIDGEEDLAVLPLVLTAPLGTNIFYGQPNEGVVRVEVTEECKGRAYDLVSRFKVLS
ncbi:MAG: pantetheine-phosphate adenylyltransferase [Candidatus Levybacteria bacterium]|nr:pantetheine-phosphate adenylyltransferase [Candidatus Levybacteria bacterium]